jgi:hypothetical protein
LKADALIKYGISVLLAAACGYLIAQKGISIAVALLALPFIIGFFIVFIRYPKTGIYSALILSFILPILSRYLPVELPFGLGVDALLVLTLLILIFKNWKYLNLSLAHNKVMLFMIAWMAYILLQIANPNAYSIMAWFYSMRGIALYQLFFIGLGLIMFNSKKDFYNFLNVWMGLTVLGILWAIKQKYLGVSAAEQAWLDAGEYKTHVLFGKLRVFSYYFDAGTFGAAMGHSCMVAAVLFTGPYSKRRKAFYLFISLFSFFALMLSGTRGALAVPALGGICYIVMIKNTRILIGGLVVLLAGFVFLKFTTIGAGNYNLDRLRTALDPEDASLQVRLINRDRLTDYLHDKPFGGGLGTVGSWGQRFSPGTWLAEFEPDGLYTRIRAETGLIGRNFYVGIWLFILLDGILWVWRTPPSEKRTLAMAMLAGYAGILLANYGNQVMTQFPIAPTVYLGISFLYSMRKWNEDGEVELEGKETPVMGASSRASSSWT